jgi:hypothetical protein
MYKRCAVPVDGKLTNTKADDVLRRQGRIGPPQVPIEPRDAERIMRKIEESNQIVIERPARLSHTP